MRWQVALMGCIASAALLHTGQVQRSQVQLETLTFEVQPSPVVRQLPKIGVNLGHWTSWGAEQLSRNILKNPGFEGQIDRSIVIVRSASEGRFTDSETWLTRPDGFWAGATAHVLRGDLRGDTFQITESGKTQDGFPVFETNRSHLGLRRGDVVTLTKTDDGQFPELWWSDPVDAHFVTAKPPRPGSPGKRSIGLTGSPGRPTAISSYLDMIGDRAGKLLPVRGRWKLSFWYRSHADEPHFSVSFRRHGAPPFLAETLAPSPKWRFINFHFDPLDDGPPGPLELRFGTSGGQVSLDDVELSESGSPESPFRSVVVETLREIQPGYLRDWQGQLGDTTANRLASPFGRQTTRYRPGKHESQYHYSLPEFLALCAIVNAKPWIVIPTTLTDEEAGSLGRYLHRAWQEHRFDEMLVEFGNENWNPLFRPAGLPDPIAHGSVAERILGRLRRESGAETPIRTVVNGQFAAPRQASQFASQANSVDLLAFAPYYLHDLQAGLPPQDRERRLLSESGLGWREISDSVPNRELAVYEVNAHTLGGSASVEERTSTIAGRVSGTAILKALMSAATAGVRRQCVYALSGFDTFLPERRGLVQLFGITRSLAETGDFRPAGLAVASLNRFLPADLHDAKSDGPDRLEVTAFLRSDRWSFLAISKAREELSIAVVFPKGGRLPAEASVLLANSPNESTTNAAQMMRTPLVEIGRTVRVKVPPFGVVFGGKTAVGENDDIE
jgi:hypothetical protein